MNILSCVFVLVGILFCLQSSEGQLSVKVPKYLCIYYGYPSSVQNSYGNVGAAINWFSQFDLIVFGGALANISHSDYNNSINITQTLVARGKRVFGYVDLGVTENTSNYSYTQMQQFVNIWLVIGVTGIFWDDAGFDYGVTRQRQFDMITYCHNKNLNVIMNAWNPDHVLNGTDVALNSNDIYILESYLVSNGSYQSLYNWTTKANKVIAYQSGLGIQVACLSTNRTSNQFTQAWFGTAMYNFDYFQATEITYGADTGLAAFYPNPSSNYGTVWKTASVVSNAAYTNFSRSTDTMQLNVVGDGVSWGYGTFTTLPQMTGGD